MKKIKKTNLVDFKKIDKNTEAAVYYGFMSIKTPEIKTEDKEKTKSLKDNHPPLLLIGNNKIKNTIEEKSALLRTYFTENFFTLPQPVLLTYNGFIFDEHNKKDNRYQKIGLEIIGSDKSIAEAILIKTALAILEDNDYENLYVEINSLGDKESCNRFIREITTYFRKNINALPAHCRQEFKKDPTLPLLCQNESCCQLKNAAPKTIGCLSDDSRKHFKEVLEYLESLNIPYRINDCLLSDRHYASGTIFEIKQKDSKGNDESLACGFRTGLLAKKMGFKENVPMIGAKLMFKPRLEKEKTTKIKKTSVFFIQLGDEAKHKSLQVIDILRQANIYINHALGRDKMSGQMATAERLKVPYILIMGKKEALEDTIMVRNVATRVQETVKISDLADYLKKLVK